MPGTRVLREPGGSGPTVLLLGTDEGFFLNHGGGGTFQQDVVLTANITSLVSDPLRESSFRLERTMDGPNP